MKAKAFFDGIAQGPLGLIARFMQEEHEFEMREWEKEEAENDNVASGPVSHTLNDISRKTGLGSDEIKRAMKDEDGETFVHMPHPTEPTRYALAAHAEGTEGWKPGLDF